MDDMKGNNLDMSNIVEKIESTEAKSHLEKFFGTKEIESLRDISDIKVDKSLPVMERLISFIEQIGNPYYFKVNGTPVRVAFTKNAHAFQESVERLVSNSN